MSISGTEVELGLSFEDEISPFFPPPNNPNFFFVFPGAVELAGDIALANSSSCSLEAVPGTAVRVLVGTVAAE